MDDFTFEPGDRVRRRNYDDGMYVDILYVGSEKFFGVLNIPEGHYSDAGVEELSLEKHPYGEAQQWELIVPTFELERTLTTEYRVPKYGEPYLPHYTANSGDLIAVEGFSAKRSYHDDGKRHVIVGLL